MTTHDWHRSRVLALLSEAGDRGLTHEQFVEAGLARDYIPQLRGLVDDDGCVVDVAFAPGGARWILRAGPAADEGIARSVPASSMPPCMLKATSIG